ncbi:polymerase delta-interacting protein 3-like isoform X2 [Ctenocephalides felis]|uniref:polymerase delta-interacting protein 3-like isoform X2 n=1 Tax=Ctenocephalides felis TaxID=7515 RepID=UPI000E6E5209|nr:polymerase delta-interacting protein 3-like isoform X2 [Ctenocephalides felis]
MDISLAEIIKKKKMQNFQKRNGKNRIPKKRGAFQSVPKANIKDARLKIIQKNRTKLVDARDKLAQIAKKTDARLKLQKLRKQNLPQNVGNGRFALSTNRSGQISLSTKRDFVRKPADLQRPAKKELIPSDFVRQPAALQWSVKNNCIRSDLPITMTFKNNYAMSRMPPLPDIGNRSSIWDSSISRNVKTIRKPQSIIPKDLHMKITVNQNVPVNRNIMESPVAMDIDDDVVDAIYERPSRYRSLREVTPPPERPQNRAISGWNSAHLVPRTNTIDLTDSVHSRLDCSPPRVRTMGILSSESKDYSRSPPRIPSRSRTQQQSRPVQSYNLPQGYRIVVSNLQANVTQEDIKELFEDVGELLESRLVRPGTAEVIFKTLADAQQAVDVYHNRQLDGQPMKCLLVNPRQGNKPTAPALKPTSQLRGYVPKRASTIAEPDLEAFHAAMFMRR